MRRQLTKIPKSVHWYLAIICYPEHILKAAPLKSPPQPTRSSQRVSMSGRAQPTSDETDTNVVSGSTITPSKSDELPSEATTPDEPCDEMQDVIDSTRSCSIIEDLSGPSEYRKVDGGGPRIVLDDDDRVSASDSEPDASSLTPLEEEEVDELADDSGGELEYPVQSVISNDGATEPSVAGMDIDPNEGISRAQSSKNDFPSHEVSMVDVDDEHTSSAVPPGTFYGTEKRASLQPARQYGKKRARPSSSSEAEVEDEVSIEKHDTTLDLSPILEESRYHTLIALYIPRADNQIVHTFSHSTHWEVNIHEPAQS